MITAMPPLHPENIRAPKIMRPKRHEINLFFLLERLFSLNNFLQFNDLRRTSFWMSFQLAILRPGIGFIVVIRITEQYITGQAQRRFPSCGLSVKIPVLM